MSETQELGRSATVPNQAVGYDAPRHGQLAEGQGAERTGNVRRRRDGLDGPGHGHLYDGTPERSYPRSRDLRVDVDLDTDAAIRGESPLQLRARPGMGYGDRHERRAHRGHQGRDRSPDTSPSSSSTPPRTAESSSPSTPIITAVGIRAASPPCRWPSRCTTRPRPRERCRAVVEHAGARGWRLVTTDRGIIPRQYSGVVNTRRPNFTPRQRTLRRSRGSGSEAFARSQFVCSKRKPLYVVAVTTVKEFRLLRI